MGTKELRMWDALHETKKGTVNAIVEELGERTLDLSEENVRVFAVDHHCNEGIWGTLGVISKGGFTMDGDTEVLYWYDMIVEDLAMVLDYLRTGSW